MSVGYFENSGNLALTELRDRASISQIHSDGDGHCLSDRRCLGRFIKTSPADQFKAYHGQHGVIVISKESAKLPPFGRQPGETA